MQVVHQSRPVVPRDRFIDGKEVDRLTGISKTTRYELMAQKRFPQPVRFSSRMVRWSETAVLQWVQDRIAEAEAGQKAGV